MTDKEYIRLAILEAKKSQTHGGAPIGAVVVKDNKVIGTGWSLVWPEKDPSSHAEINAIRAACKNLQSLDLIDCTLYSTLESCSMCLGCAAWAGLNRIVFGAFGKDVQPNPYEMVNYDSTKHIKLLRIPAGGGIIEIKGGVLRKECQELMKNIKNWTPIL